MKLLIGEETLTVAKLGPDFLVLAAAAEHPPGEAEVIVSVDGRKRSWLVRLPEGIAGSKRIPVAFRKTGPR